MSSACHMYVKSSSCLLLTTPANRFWGSRSPVPQGPGQLPPPARQTPEWRRSFEARLAMANVLLGLARVGAAGCVAVKLQKACVGLGATGRRWPMANVLLGLARVGGVPGA